MTSVKHRGTTVSDQSWKEQRDFRSLQSYGFFLIAIATAGTLYLSCWEQTLASDICFWAFWTDWILPMWLFNTYPSEYFSYRI